ncbi:Uma2 family endonuclease [Leptolyngbya sp. AN03gr2]|uniref:Uma2 family endonuclease n=1 Tax=unclassified Leptolyngbya TaxID=2650499 RepID=UPI003D31EE0A
MEKVAAPEKPPRMYWTNPPKPAKEALPTMYDLPSEDPEEPGLPDEFHAFQPQLLRSTFDSPAWSAGHFFIGTDINLYYEPRHPLWHKRPDWFVVLGVQKSTSIEELRLSYVIWQESIAPFLVVELLSPGTEDEDLGQTLRDVDKPPTKWEVYERILRVPYYVIFDRYINEFRAFKLEGLRYRELSLPDSKLWFEEIQIGLGVWQGCYELAEGKWLRWYDVNENWLPTDQERAEQERERAQREQERAEQERERAQREQERAEQERERAQREQERAEQAERELEEERSRAQQLAERLRSLGINPEEV